jgi:uncharacterized membrane protein (DUF485 family)
MSLVSLIIVIPKERRHTMSKEIRSFLLIYILPICLISLFFVFFAPALYSVVILGMVSSVALMVMGMAFIIDWMDKR